MLEKFIPFLKGKSEEELQALTPKQEEELREQVARITGVTASEVDLDAPLFTSGVVYRRYRRAVARDRAKARRRGQRNYNRQVRTQREVQWHAQGQRMVLDGPDTPMRRNVVRADEMRQRLVTKMEADGERRKARHAAHAARRAELGQDEYGRQQL